MNKRIISLLLTVLVLSSIISITVTASEYIKVYINGEKISFDVNPQMIDNRTMVPMRAIFEELGASVEWDSETETITGKKDNTTIVMQLDNKTLKINEEKTLLDVAPTEVDGRTLVPVRAVAESLGVEVIWYDEINVVAIHEDTENISYTKLYTSDYELLEVEENLLAEYKAIGWSENSANVKVVMYSADDKKILVSKSDISSYKYQGWYLSPVSEVYSADGRKLIIPKNEITAYKEVGWYTYPVITIYAPDGRSLVIPQSEYEEYKNVGWFPVPVTLMYSTDGSTAYIATSKIEQYKANGWYTEPVQLMYAPDGRTLYVMQSEIEAHKNVGWYTEPVQIMYAADGRTIDVPKNEIEAYKKVGWYTEDDYIFIQADKNVKDYGYETAISTLEEYTNKRYDSYIEDDILREKIENKIKTLLSDWKSSIGGAPLAIIGWTRSENSIDTPEINITLRNVSEKTVIAFEAKFTCYDAYGNVTSDVPSLYNGSVNVHADRTTIHPGECATYTSPLYSNERTSKISWPYLLKAAYSDGSTWYR